MQFDGILFQQNKSLSPDPFDFLKIKNKHINENFHHIEFISHCGIR